MCVSALQGDVEVIEEPTKSRSKPKPRAPKPAAHDAANSDGTAAGATKKRKQQDKQQQQQQQHKEGTTGSVAAAAASNGLDASRKKRQRHEVPAAPAATGFTTSDKPPAPKRVCCNLCLSVPAANQKLTSCLDTCSGQWVKICSMTQLVVYVNMHDVAWFACVGPVIVKHQTRTVWLLGTKAYRISLIITAYLCLCACHSIITLCGSYCPTGLALNQSHTALWHTLHNYTSM